MYLPSMIYTPVKFKIKKKMSDISVPYIVNLKKKRLILKEHKFGWTNKKGKQQIQMIILYPETQCKHFRRPSLVRPNEYY